MEFDTQRVARRQRLRVTSHGGCGVQRRRLTPTTTVGAATGAAVWSPARPVRWQTVGNKSRAGALSLRPAGRPHAGRTYVRTFYDCSMATGDVGCRSHSLEGRSLRHVVARLADTRFKLTIHRSLSFNGPFYCCLSLVFVSAFCIRVNAFALNFF